MHLTARLIVSGFAEIKFAILIMERTRGPACRIVPGVEMVSATILRRPPFPARRIVWEVAEMALAIPIMQRSQVPARLIVPEPAEMRFAMLLPAKL